MVSGDKNALDQKSAVFSRLVSYARLVKRLDVVVVCDSTDEIVEGSLKIQGSGGNKMTRYWRTYKIAAMMRDIDVVTSQDPFELGFLSLRLAKRYGARLHVQCHTDPFSPHFAAQNSVNRIRRFIARYALKRASAIRVVSDRIRRSLHSYTKAPISVLPIVQPELKKPDEIIDLPFKESIVTVCRLEAEKNVDVCIKTIVELRKKRPECGLIIVGDGSLRKRLEEIVRARNAEQFVNFVGNVLQEKVASYLAGAKAYIQASSYEGYGLSLLQAAYMQLPIVTTDVGLVGDVLRDKESCLVFEQGDFDAASRLLDSVLSDEETAKHLGMRAYEAALATEKTKDAYAQEIVSDWKIASTSTSKKLLILTQIMDRNHPALGFFVRWVEAISKQSDKVTVICLQKGDSSGLPESVEVLSLGKEDRTGKFEKLKRLFTYILWKRREYDSVFVHMNQEYVLLCGWIWKILRKRITMWRNHHAGTLLTKIAGRICDAVYCTSRFSYTADFKNIHFMPVGIDTELFTPDGTDVRNVNTVLSVGRLDRSKKLDVLIGSFAKASEAHSQAQLDIIGAPTDALSTYPDELKTLAQSLGVGEKVYFLGSVKNKNLPQAYRQRGIFVNCSSSGMYDKTIFEAMACGCVVVASNENLRGQYDDRFIIAQDDVAACGQAISTALSFDEGQRKTVTEHGLSLVRNKHSLVSLVASLNRALYRK